MTGKDENVSNWLESCPLPVVGRVVEDTETIRHISFSEFIYEQGTLVVIPLATLAKLFSEK